MKRHDDNGSPARDAIRLYVERMRSAAPVARSWARLQGPAAAKSSVSVRVWASAIAGAILAALVLGGRSLWQTRPREDIDLPTANAQQGHEPDRSAPPKSIAILGLTGTPIRLPVGPARLSTTIEVTAEPPAEATAAIRDDQPRVELAEGRIRVDSIEREDRRKVHVWVGPYEFVDIGTVFEVSRDASTVSLSVRDGAVQVLRDGGQLARVAAGETWHGALQQERTTVEGPPAARRAEGQRPAADETNHDHETTSDPAPDRDNKVATDAGAALACRKLAASGRKRVASTCYENLARGSDLLAQTALYELANLRRDGGDSSGALATLRSYGVRFPNGALATEVELSMIELLAKLNQHGEALDRSAALLARQPHLERSSDLRLLRGNIYREAMHDLRRAAIEYDEAQKSRGRAAVDALFLAASCAEALGEPESAARLYTRYLSHGDGLPHAADARNRLLAIASSKK